MGMGYGANYADVVEESFVKKTCPKELKAFKKSVEQHMDDDLGEFVQSNLYGYKDVPEAVALAYNALVQAFKKKTKLSLELDYHDPDNGDRYDDINGFFWTVDGAWKRTTAGEKYQKQIQRKMFVTFG